MASSIFPSIGTCAASPCLVISENVLLQKILSKWLNSAGLICKQCIDFEQVSIISSSEKFSIVFIDFPFPNFPTLSQIHNLRTQEPNIQTPVIALIASECNHESWNKYIHDCLRKPFNRDELTAIIQKWASVSVPALATDSLSSLPQVPPQDIALFDVFGTELEDLFDCLQDQNSSVHSKTFLKCLVVEDNSITQKVVTAHLQGIGFFVVQAFDGKEAVQACKDHVFDVIFMDISMPGMNGLVATQYIRKFSPANSTTPIIAFSSSGSADEFTKLGLNDFLPKPFTANTLESILRKWTCLKLDPSPNLLLPISSSASSHSQPSRSHLSPSVPTTPSLTTTAASSTPAIHDAASRIGSSDSTPPISEASHPGDIPMELFALKDGQKVCPPPNIINSSSILSPLCIDSSASSSSSCSSVIRNLANLNHKLSMEEKGFESQISLKKFKPAHLSSKLSSQDFAAEYIKDDKSRIHHNIKERNRRKEISDAVESFRSMLPNVSLKLDKASVLKEAVECMGRLIEENQTLKESIKSLQSQNSSPVSQPLLENPST